MYLSVKQLQPKRLPDGVPDDPLDDDVVEQRDDLLERGSPVLFGIPARGDESAKTLWDVIRKRWTPVFETHGLDERGEAVDVVPWVRCRQKFPKDDSYL